MALATLALFSFGDPGGTGFININLGGQQLRFYYKLKCPRQRKNGPPHEVVKNGHDTSVKGHPQQYHCKTCGANFYAHTSGYFHDLFHQLKQLLKHAFKGGRLDLQQLTAKFDLSPSAASRLLAALLRHLGELAESKRSKEFPRNSKVIFCDETFLKIQGEQWYIVVLRNEEGKVLDAFLTRHRDVKVLLPHFCKVMARLKRGVEFLVTDDFTAYQALVLALQTNIIHVRCVHKPPYGRIIINIVRWERGVAHYTTVATISDVLKQENTFFARVSKRTKKPKGASGKKGRNKGSKNRPKEVVAAEKVEKARKKAEKAKYEFEKAEQAAKRARQEAEAAKSGIMTARAEGDALAPSIETAAPVTVEKSPRKRGRKNWSREGEVHVFHYDPKAGEVRAYSGSEDAVATMFTQLLAYFAGKCITTNTEEEFFSTFKRLVHFSGWRSPDHWQQLINLYVTLREEETAAAHLVDMLEFRPHMLRKNINKLITVEV